MITENKITEIFCLVDDCKCVSFELKKHQISIGEVHHNRLGAAFRCSGYNDTDSLSRQGI